MKKCLRIGEIFMEYNELQVRLVKSEESNLILKSEELDCIINLMPFG